MIDIKKNYKKQVSYSLKNGWQIKRNYWRYVTDYLNKWNCEIHNFIARLKIKFKKYVIKYGYVSLIGLVILVVISDLIIHHYYKINYLLKVYKFIFLSRSSAEWFSGIGTVATFLLALHKLFGRTKPGLRFHVDRDNVCVEVINNSSTSGFALMKHVYIGDSYGHTSPFDYISLFKNDTYSEPLGVGNKVLIYLKHGKNDDRLKLIIDMSRSLTKSKSLRDYHYIIVEFNINDHILPITSEPLDINKLNYEEWPHSESYYEKKNEERRNYFTNCINKLKQK